MNDFKSLVKVYEKDNEFVVMPWFINQPGTYDPDRYPPFIFDSWTFYMKQEQDEEKLFIKVIKEDGYIKTEYPIDCADINHEYIRDSYLYNLCECYWCEIDEIDYETAIEPMEIGVIGGSIRFKFPYSNHYVATTYRSYIFILNILLSFYLIHKNDENDLLNKIFPIGISQSDTGKVMMFNNKFTDQSIKIWLTKNTYKKNLKLIVIKIIDPIKYKAKTLSQSVLYNVDSKVLEKQLNSDPCYAGIKKMYKKEIEKQSSRLTMDDFKFIDEHKYGKYGGTIIYILEKKYHIFKDYKFPNPLLEKEFKIYLNNYLNNYNLYGRDYNI